MKKSDSIIPPAPKGLSATARQWWKKIHQEYELLEPDRLLLLEAGLQSYDRWQAARAVLDREGVTVLDRFSQAKMHPLFFVERDSRLSMLRSFRQLGLDLAPLDEAR